ncbi:MAG TPA: hypothetical protein HPQ04_05815 [Rhodospirillaceae bacterium]|nr:hypothetical protein [Rhodospirillaceae bacterium]
MSFWSITLFSLAAGLILVVGGALVVHMGNLVRNAYELKIEIKADVEEGQKRIEAEVDKRLKWIKRDLIEDLEKSKEAMQIDSQRRLTELANTLEKRLAEQTDGQAKDRAATVKTLEGLQADLLVLDQRLRNLRRELQTVPAPTEAPAPAVEQPPTEPPQA